MRHTFVSLLSANGTALEDIADLVGHRGTATTETVSARLQRTAPRGLFQYRTKSRATAAPSDHQDATEWEYRQSVRHLRGWDPVAV
jgi:hypothetical protein